MAFRNTSGSIPTLLSSVIQRFVRRGCGRFRHANCRAGADGRCLIIPAKRPSVFSADNPSVMTAVDSRHRWQGMIRR